MKKYLFLVYCLVISLSVFSQQDTAGLWKLYQIGDSLYQNKNYIFAYRAMNGVILMFDSTYADAHYMKSKILTLMEEYKRAEEEINIAINVNPNKSDYYICRGNIYENYGKFENAIHDYHTAINLDSLNADAYESRASIWVELDYPNYEKRCLSDYDKAIKINPNLWNYYFNRAQFKESIGDIEGACKDWKRAVELGYADMEWYNKISECSQ